MLILLKITNNFEIKILLKKGRSQEGQVKKFQLLE